MRSGDEYLAAAATDAAELRRLDAERKVVRSRLLTNLRGAESHNKTQEAIGKACRYSRQRIGQFLKEAPSDHHRHTTVNVDQDLG